MARSLWILVCFLFIGACGALRMVMLDVPAAANAGESVELACVYELEGDRLYSIKWYRDDVEFYRYVPNDWPPGQFLPLPGVKVDLSKSGHRSVFLRAVELSSEGTYRCEVSAEAPSFQSVEAEATLNVMVLPTEGPVISGEAGPYDVGDVVTLNCTSPKSKPAATLRWFVNDAPVGGDWTTEFAASRDAEGLSSASLGLRLPLRARHLAADGSARARCTASVSSGYAMSSERTLRPSQHAAPLLTDHDDENLPKPGTKKKGMKQHFILSGASAPFYSSWILILVIALHWKIS